MPKETRLRPVKEESDSEEEAAKTERSAEYNKHSRGSTLGTSAVADVSYNYQNLFVGGLH